MYRPSRHRKRGDRGRTDHQQGECCGAAEKDSRERVLPRDGTVGLEGSGPRLGQAQRWLDGQSGRAKLVTKLFLISITLNFPGLVVFYRCQRCGSRWNEPSQTQAHISLGRV